jgi:hypothetical protein
MKTIYQLMLFSSMITMPIWLSAQTISSPELNVPYACATPSFNNYSISVSYTAPGFQTGNIFILELSNGNGSFTTASELARVTNQSYRSAWAFDISNIIFPQNIGGDNFKMRIRSTNPVRTSAESRAFTYYWYDNTSIVLNNYRPVVLCSGQSTTISVTGTNATRFRWYKNGIVIPQQEDSSLFVNDAGVYFAEVFLGSCNLNIPNSISNATTVILGPVLNASIDGPSNVDICQGISHTFRAVGVPPNYNVQWYRNGSAVTTVGNFLTYTTPTTGAEGNYTFNATPLSAGCSGSSPPVRLSYQSSFSVSLTSAANTVLLPAQTANLVIATTAASSVISWFRNNNPIPSSNSLTLNTNQIGVYRAEVTTTGPCAQIISSPDITVSSPTGFEVNISMSADYQACQATATVLSIQDINAITTTGRRDLIQQSNWSAFSFQWLRNGLAIPGETSATIRLDTAHNASYALKIGYAGVFYTSNTIGVRLSDMDSSIIVGATSICPGETTTLEAAQNANYSYAWFRNNTAISGANTYRYEVTEEGSYTCEITAFGCTSRSISTAITLIRETDIVIAPANQVRVAPNGSVTFTATGGLSYEWFNDIGVLLSSTNNLVASSPGRYTLISQSGACSFTSEVEVVEEVSGIIPNVVTQNGDGINESWVLPSSYTSASIEISIFSEDGNRVLQTNNYQGNWPESNAYQRNNSIFYYVIKENNKILKRGTITILK